MLTAYDGDAITYDGIGNPLTDGTWTYTWKHGRELASMTDGTTTWVYEYNADGLRTSRSNGTTTYEYIYNGSSLTQMTVTTTVNSGTPTTDTLYFTSDTVTLNGTTYYYVKNLQGDITAILNSSGTAVVTYSYDAWGNILSMSDTSGVNLGTLNPLRYRGYVYDQESGLYYLQSRYYDPEVGRFINADALVSTGQGPLGNNMYTYCLNSPVLMADSNGERTYFINGIHNEDEEDEPEYAKRFCSLLSEMGESATAIPVYNGQKGLLGYVEGAIEAVCEMANQYIYAMRVAQYILDDLAANPLAEGEEVNLVGYSGGGQIALNVMALLPGQIDNIVLIGTPVMEVWYSTTEVSMLYSFGDPFSWNIGFGYSAYCVGTYGHDGYFSSENITDTVNTVYDILRG